MGLLSDERFDEFVKDLESVTAEPQPEEPTSEPVEASEEVPESDDSQDSKPAEDVSSEDTEDVKGEVETKGDDEGESASKAPESVPYGRFKEVNDKFRSRESELERAQERIQQLEQLTLREAQERSKQPEEPVQTDDEWLSELVSGSDQTDAVKKLSAELKSVRDWQQSRTQQLITDQLSAEIRAAVEANPEVKADELWQAVAADGTVDVADMAKRVQVQRDEMKSRYTADAQTEVEALKAKLAEFEKGASNEATFTRPSGGTSAPPPAAKPVYRSIADAANGFAEALKERMS